MLLENGEIRRNRKIKNRKLKKLTKCLLLKKRNKIYRQKNIEKSKTRPYDGHIKNKKRVKSSRRKPSKKLIENM